MMQIRLAQPSSWLGAGLNNSVYEYSWSEAEEDQSFPDPMQTMIMKATTDEEFLQYLLQSPYTGHLLDFKGPNGSTILVMLAKQGREDELREVIKRGASVDFEALEFDDSKLAFEKRRRTPLLEAAGSGQVDTLEALIELGADVHLGKSDTGASAVLVAAQSGHVDVIEVLAKYNADLNRRTLNDGTPPVWMAAQEGQSKVIRALALLNADLNLDKENSGTPPIWIAAQEGHLETVSMLAKFGADVNQIRRTDGAIAAHITAQQGNIEMIRLLVACNSFLDFRKSDTGATPIYLASQEGHTEMVRELLTLGASISLERHDGLSPLHVAAHVGHLDVVRVLACFGADLTQCNKNGHTAADSATSPVADWLTYVAGHTPLEIAAYCGDSHAIHYLLQSGANPDELLPLRLPRVYSQPRLLTNTVLPPVDTHIPQHRSGCTLDLLLRVSKGWSPKIHNYYSKPMKERIETTLLVAQRQRSSQNGIRLPIEIWLYVIFPFFSLKD
eukprot:m.332998 g.332998  ORF g.332998 m.332998 type:complete len:501 (+) comp17042_c0_seq1:313-1815(+)